MKLTPSQRAVLEGGAEAVCNRGVWRWLLRNEPVGREVHALIKRGLARASYYHGCRAALDATDKGRAVLVELQQEGTS